MSDYFRAGVGLLLGATVGLLLVRLLDDFLLRHGHGLNDAFDVGIVIAAAVVGFGAGVSSSSRK